MSRAPDAAVGAMVTANHSIRIIDHGCDACRHASRDRRRSRRRRVCQAAVRSSGAARAAAADRRLPRRPACGGPLVLTAVPCRAVGAVRPPTALHSRPPLPRSVPSFRPLTPRKPTPLRTAAETTAQLGRRRLRWMGPRRWRLRSGAYVCVPPLLLSRPAPRHSGSHSHHAPSQQASQWQRQR